MRLEGCRIEIDYLDGTKSSFDIENGLPEVREHLSEVLSNAAYETPAFLHFSTHAEEVYIKVETAALIRVMPTSLVDTDAPPEEFDVTEAPKTKRRPKKTNQAEPERGTA